MRWKYYEENRKNQIQITQKIKCIFCTCEEMFFNAFVWLRFMFLIWLCLPLRLLPIAEAQYLPICMISSRALLFGNQQNTRICGWLTTHGALRTPHHHQQQQQSIRAIKWHILCVYRIQCTNLSTTHENRSQEQHTKCKTWSEHFVVCWCLPDDTLLLLLLLLLLLMNVCK